VGAWSGSREQRPLLTTRRRSSLSESKLGVWIVFGWLGLWRRREVERAPTKQDGWYLGSLGVRCGGKWS